tara:strand:+ start:371 stop:766 length:396 start_codon:yes stop_codon:yes gene_type:complete
MLRAKEVVLNDGTIYKDVILLPHGESILIEITNDAGDQVLREITLSKVKHIDYSDEQSVYFVRGLALAELAMSVDEMQEFMEDRGWDNSDLVEALKEASSIEDETQNTQADSQSVQSLPKGLDGSNPYGGK